jgi:hypothetical protein
MNHLQGAMPSHSTVAPSTRRQWCIRVRSWAALMLLSVVPFAGASCDGPSNPEPIMMDPTAMSIFEDPQGSVSFTGTELAVVGADHLEIVDVDQAVVQTLQLTPTSGFGTTIGGFATDRYRLTAWRTSDGEFAVIHVTGSGLGTTEATEIDPTTLGCLSVSPTRLDLGSGPVGEPLYGEVTVKSTCAEPPSFLGIVTTNVHFHVSEFLTTGEQILLAGDEAIVSVTPLPPRGGTEFDATMTLQPAPVSTPARPPPRGPPRATATP